MGNLRHTFWSLLVGAMVLAPVGHNAALAADITGQNVTINSNTTDDANGAKSNANGTNIYGNKLTITGGDVGVYSSPGTAGRSAYGGASFGYTGSIHHNEVIMTGGRVILTIDSGDGYHGGSVVGGVASGVEHSYFNKVTISGGIVDGDIYGGQADDGDAYDNEVIISGSAIIGYGDGAAHAVVEGGHTKGNAYNNTVTLNGGTVNGSIYGGDVYADTKAYNNTVTINGGTVNDGAIGGGFAGDGGEVTGNTVNINGGILNLHSSYGIYGGINDYGATTDEVSRNTVNIRSGANITSGDIYGGYSHDSSGGVNPTGNVINNTVNLYGGTLHSAIKIFGGLSDNGGDEFTGNTLNVAGFSGTVGEIKNFEFYKFFIPASITNGGKLLTLTGGATDLTGSQVTAITLHSQSPLGQGDKVVLIDKVAGTFTDTNLQAQKGASMMYDVVVKLDGTELIVTLGGGTAIDPAAHYNPQSKSLAQVGLGGLTLLNQGADLVVSKGVTSAAQSLGHSSQAGQPAIFATSSLGGFKTETGSHIDSQGWSLLSGLAWTDDLVSQARWIVGLFFETGRGSYDAYNSFANLATVHSSGNNDYFGGGLMASYHFASGFHTETSFRYGRLESDFQAEGYLGEVQPSFDLDTNYTSAHFGLGFDRQLNDKIKLDVVSKYLWTRQNAQNVNILGDTVRFEAIDSQRLRAGAELEFTADERVRPYVGAYFEHEFDGEAKARNLTVGLNHLAPGVKGSTGIGELGLRLIPAGDSGLMVDLSLQGHTGRRDGVSGNLSLKWQF